MTDGNNTGEGGALVDHLSPDARAQLRASIERFIDGRIASRRADPIATKSMTEPLIRIRRSLAENVVIWVRDLVTPRSVGNQALLGPLAGADGAIEPSQDLGILTPATRLHLVVSAPRSGLVTVRLEVEGDEDTGRVVAQQKVSAKKHAYLDVTTAADWPNAGELVVTLDSDQGYETRYGFIIGK